MSQKLTQRANLITLFTINSDAKYDKSIGCSEEFTPKLKIFAVSIVRNASLQSSTSSAILNSHACNMKKEIQLWSSNLGKQVTDFAQGQREFFVTKNTPFSYCCVSR